MINDMIAELHPQARTRWRQLSDEQRDVVRRKFARYLRSCKASDIDPEHVWLAESIHDAKMPWYSEPEPMAIGV